MTERRFAGRVALVTGGSSGIGAAVAGRLLLEGARVASLDLTEGGLDGVLMVTGVPPVGSRGKRTSLGDGVTATIERFRRSAA